MRPRPHGHSGVPTEAYRPTADERRRLRAAGDRLTLSGDGVFMTRQGEGPTAGRPAVFLRLHRCNLRCGAAGGWRCDTWYTWDEATPEYWREPVHAEVAEVACRVRETWSGPDGKNRLVITGGEPLLQQDRVIELIGMLPGWQIEIETNGTVLPRAELAAACQLNCSPKLASSGNGLRARRRLEALRAIADAPRSIFKFVVAGPDDVPEIEQLIRSVPLRRSRVVLMSEGTTAATLRERDAVVAGLARALGVGMTRRHHIFWYGDVRGT